MKRQALKDNWEIIKAYKNGEDIQIKGKGEKYKTWYDTVYPQFDEDYLYRVKPSKYREVSINTMGRSVKVQEILFDRDSGIRWDTETGGEREIKHNQYENSILTISEQGWMNGYRADAYNRYFDIYPEVIHADIEWKHLFPDDVNVLLVCKELKPIHPERFNVKEENGVFIPVCVGNGEITVHYRGGDSIDDFISKEVFSGTKEEFYKTFRVVNP